MWPSDSVKSLLIIAYFFCHKPVNEHFVHLQLNNSNSHTCAKHCPMTSSTDALFLNVCFYLPLTNMIIYRHWQAACMSEKNVEDCAAITNRIEKKNVLKQHYRSFEGINLGSPYSLMNALVCYNCPKSFYTHIGWLAAEETGKLPSWGCVIKHVIRTIVT